MLEKSTLSNRSHTTHGLTADRPTPLFIVGMPRGGANAVRELLNQHPQINIGYNLRTFSQGPQLYRRTRGLDQIKPFRRFLDRLARLEGDSMPRAWLVNVYTADAERLFDAHRTKPGFATIVEAAFKLANPDHQVIGNKCTHPNICREMLQIWPHARVISVIRDPRGGAFAFRKHDQRQRLRYAALHWNMHVDWTAKMVDQFENLLLIRYEHLINGLQPQLSRLLLFAGFNDQEIAERIANKSRSDRMITDQWRAQLEKYEQRAIEKICFNRMKACGYQPDLAKREHLPGTALRLLEHMLQWLADRRAASKPHKPHLSHNLAPVTP